MSAFSAIFVLKENGTQSHSAKFLNWGDHVNSVPDLAASPPWFKINVFSTFCTESVYLERDPYTHEQTRMWVYFLMRETDAN